MENLRSKPKRNLRKHFRIAAFLGVSLSGLAASMNAHADLTWFSRANCFSNNESISWHANNPKWLWTNSWHYYQGAFQHCENSAGYICGYGSGWEYTWRSAVVHQFEGYGGWGVYGEHWRWNVNLNKVVYMGTTSASGCNPTHW